jgi:hypothetical protein
MLMCGRTERHHCSIASYAVAFLPRGPRRSVRSDRDDPVRSKSDEGARRVSSPLHHRGRTDAVEVPKRDLTGDITAFVGFHRCVADNTNLPVQALAGRLLGALDVHVEPGSAISA